MNCPLPKYRKEVPLLLAIVLAWLFLFLAPPARAAAYPYFTEDFNGEFSEPDKWNADSPEGCSITFPSNTIRLEAEPFHGRFPYITTNQTVFPEGDFSVETSFRFIFQGLGEVGTGIAITDTEPPPVGTFWLDIHNYSILFAWPLGGTTSGIITSLCPETEPDCAPGHRIISAPPTDPSGWQRLKIDFNNSKYYLFLDGNSIFTSAPTQRTSKYLWLGSPVVQSCLWSSFEVDYIHINRIIDSVTFESLIQEIKNLPLSGKEAKLKRMLIEMTKIAQLVYNKTRRATAAQQILRAELKLVERAEQRGILEPDPANWLIFNLQTLINSL